MLCLKVLLAAAIAGFAMMVKTGEVSSRSLNTSEYQSQYESLSTNFLQYIASAYGYEAKSRTKRQIISYDSFFDTAGVSNVYSIKPLLALCSPTLKIEFLDVNGLTYVVCISIATEYNPAMVHLGYLTPLYVSLRTWYVSSPKDLALFYEQEFLYVLVADSSKDEGIELVKFHIKTNTSQTYYTVHSKCPTAVSVWKSKLDNHYHMAVANTNCNQTDWNTVIYTYIWTGTYFDLYSSFTAYEVKDIEPLHIHGITYLAVANQKKGNSVADSEIFKYNLDQNKWLSHQKIRTYEALDWEFFSLGHGTSEEFFLAVANNGQHDVNVNASSMVYKLVGDVFVPFQCLKTFAATAIAAIKKDSAILLCIASENGVQFFQYDGWQFKPARIEYTQITMSSGVKALSFHQIMHEKTIILAVSNAKPRFRDEPSVFKVEFINGSYSQQWYKESTDWCMNKLEVFQKPDIMNFLEMNNFFFVDQTQPVYVNGSMHFEDGIEAVSFVTPKLLVNSDVYDDSIMLKLASLKNRLHVINNRISIIYDILTNALKTSGNQNIYALYEFQDVTFPCERNMCLFDINTTIINGEEVDLNTNVIFLDQPTVISQLSAESITSVNDMNVGGMVDGLSFQTAVTNSGNHSILGYKKFTSNVYAEDISVGVFDNVNFFASTILLTHGHQNVKGTLSIRKVATKWLEMKDLNSVSIAGFYNNIVLVDGEFNITGKKTFDSVHAAELRVNSDSGINQVNLESLWHRVLWNYGNQEISGLMTFSSISGRNLIVHKSVNEIFIPGPQVLFLQRHIEVPFAQIFQRMTSIHQLSAINYINSLSVDTTGELNILRKKKLQKITGRKSFRKIVLYSDSLITGVINGVDLSAFYKNLFQVNQPLGTNFWSFNNLIVRGHLNIGGNISGVNIEKLYMNALRLDEQNASLESLIFQDFIQVDEVYSDSMNGGNLSNLVKINEAQIITGMKTFHDVVLKSDSSILRKMNTIDLSFLRHLLLKLGNQILGSKKMKGNILVKHITVNGYINGINSSEIIPLDSRDGGEKTLEDVTFDELSIKHLRTSSIINNLDLKSVMMDSLTYDGNQIVTGKKFVNAIRLIPQSRLSTNQLNGIDLSALFEDAVLVHKEQSIAGNVIFAAPVAFQYMLTHDSIDNVTSWDMKFNWMTQHSNQLLNSSVKFLNVVANGLSVKETINNLYIEQLSESMVKLDELVTIDRPLIFENIVFSFGDIVLSGKVQGIDISEDAVINFSDKELMGKQFADLVVEDLISSGLIDNVNISELCQNALLLNQEHSLVNVKVLGDVTFKNEVNIEGNIAGVDVVTLFEKATSLNIETLVTGKKTFLSLEIEGNLIVKGRFGGINVTNLMDSYMSISLGSTGDITLHHFEELNIQGFLHARDVYTSDRKVGIIDMKQISENYLKTNGQQNIDVNHTFINVFFEDDVVVVGKINGIELPKGLMRRNRTNYIHSSKVFTQPLYALGDINLEDGKTIVGIDVSDWYSSVTKKQGRFEINGYKAFSSASVSDMRIVGLLDGMEVSESSLMLTYGTQTISGPKSISGNVEIHGNIKTDSLNHLNITIINNAVQNEQVTTFSAPIFFKSPLSVKRLDSDMIDGVNISELYALVENNLVYRSFELRFQDMDDRIAEVNTAIFNQVEFQYYELFQSFETLDPGVWLYISTSHSEFLLLSDFTQMSDGCTRVLILEYNRSMAEFQLEEKSLKSSFAAIMKVLYAWNSTLVVIGNSKLNSLCMGENATVIASETGNAHSAIYYYDPTSNDFLQYQNFITESVIDIVSFSDKQSACLVVIEIHDVVVFCAKEMYHDFILHQRLKTSGGRQATITQSDEYVILAIACVDSATRFQSVDVYFWNSHDRTFQLSFHLKGFLYIESVAVLSHSFHEVVEIFLLIAEGTIPHINNKPKLFIYKYDGRNFNKVQEIQDGGTLTWTTFSTGELAIFVLNKLSATINIYVQKGASGFIKCDYLQAIDVVTFHAFKRNSLEEKTHHYLGLISKSNHRHTNGVATNNAVLLKMKEKTFRKPY